MSANMHFVRPALAVLVALSLGLAACGRRGALEPPPGAAAEQGQKLPGQPNAKPERRFLLDPLIE